MTLREIAKQILDKNPGTHVGGSLGLNLQKIKTRRTPEDIDINIPFNYNFLPIEGMEFISENEEGDGSEEQDGFDKTTYKYEGIKVEVFKPNVRENELQSFKKKRINVNLLF